MVEIISKKNGSFDVRFFYPAPAGHSVALAGMFNDWDPARNEMAYSAKDGGYICKIALSAGVYEYKMVVDGPWLLDESNKDFVSNDFGTLNSIVEIK